MEEKRIYYVGIDHGNHLMKTSNHVFENGVERQAVKPTFQANTLVYDGAFYKIGEKRNSVKDSKLADDDYYLLTLAALAKECQSGNIPNGAGVVLGVGLPLKQFATVRKQFVKYLKRGNQPVHFKFEDVAYDFTIENVLAFPQCYAAVADRLGSMKGEYLIVDVGSWTIDIMHVKDGVPVESKCETFTESMISVIQEIKSRSSEVFGKEISENVITDYISNFGGNYPEKIGYFDLYTKGGKLRRLYIPQKLRKETLEWLEEEHRSSGYLFLNRYGDRITTRGISQQLKNYAEKYGLDKKVVYPHSFRHRYAKNFLEKYNDIALLADLMGHESIETTRIYLRRTASEQQELVDKIVTW